MSSTASDRALHAWGFDDRERDRSPGGNENHRQERVGFADPTQQVEAFLAGRPAREVHVLQHQRARVLRQPLDRGVGRAASSIQLAATSSAAESPNIRVRVEGSCAERSRCRTRILPEMGSSTSRRSH